MIVEFKLALGGMTPSKAHSTDAGFDLYSVRNEGIAPNTMATISTGVFMDIPPGYVGLLFSRSGMGKSGLRLSNCVGVVDSGYQGEIKVMIHNDSTLYHTIPAAAKIAQLVIIPLPMVQLNYVSEFKNDSARGEKGFGSSG
jgi:dUTP pyrophosphatase